MKATIDERGCLTVAAESAIEVYALRCWHLQWQQDGASAIASDTPIASIFMVSLPIEAKAQEE
jgi:hypothetical protein